jgi:hypothetical protein
MKKSILIFLIILTSLVTVSAQKGVDTQTQKITEKTGTNDKTVNNGVWSTSWGKDKTKVREKLANPYKLASRRDILVETILNLLKEKKLVLDESASKLSEGIIITQPYTFTKGIVTARNELNRYAILPGTFSNWRGGRYSLRIDVESVDGIQNNVSVTAKIEGKAENGLSSEWTTVTSSGQVEDEFLAMLVENVTGKPVDEPQPEDKPKTEEKPKKDN